ncbi:hypothetical protein QBC34DRAFT_456941 [Podospora aff. communis PSN243]|uniref:Velvet domain-containing protein n=1 Tax=Podospora aff. communis PSN243 TaxID=3040156 RepID=A0AAV9GT14_9PEZI|nr:hypothetical protein QBC34DRAFT_456941 [Podospora aff. communis PSN243]
MELGLTFGAIGDFISIAMLIKDLSSALNDSRGSSKACTDFVETLVVIERTLREADVIYRDLPEGNTMRESARQISGQIQRCVAQVEGDIKKYQPSLVHGGSGNSFRDAARKIQWKFVDERDIERHRSQLMGCCTLLGLCLQVTAGRKVSRSKSGDFSRTWGTPAQFLFARLNAVLQMGSGLLDSANQILNLVYAISDDIRSLHRAVTSLQRSLPGEHLYFEIEDPTGRLLPIPIKTIKSWEALDFILAEQFKGRKGARRVMNGQYVLKENKIGRRVSRNSPWYAAFEPYRKVDMALLYNSTAIGCPSCGNKAIKYMTVEVQCTKCRLFYYGDPGEGSSTKLDFGQDSVQDLVEHQRSGPASPAQGRHHAARIDSGESEPMSEDETELSSDQEESDDEDDSDSDPEDIDGFSRVAILGAFIRTMPPKPRSFASCRIFFRQQPSIGYVPGVNAREHRYLHPTPIMEMIAFDRLNQSLQTVRECPTMHTSLWDSDLECPKNMSSGSYRLKVKLMALDMEAIFSMQSSRAPIIATIMSEPLRVVEGEEAEGLVEHDTSLSQCLRSQGRRRLHKGAAHQRRSACFTRFPNARPGLPFLSPNHDNIPHPQSHLMERENAPLLGSTGQSNGQDPPRNPHPIRDMFWPEFSPSFKYCIALELLCELAVMVITVPMVSVLERGVCLRYYPHGGIPGPEHCKILPIQQTLAEIRGWMASFETLAAILVALPLGRIVDHRGHRRLFMVIVTGMLLSLTWTLIIANNLAIPIKWVWASSFFLLIGGGRYAAEMLLAVMIAKACTEENRTQGLYQFYSCFIFSELVAPAISSVTSYISSSLPFVISYILLFSAFPLLLMMPQGDASSSVTTAMNPGRNQHVRDGQESRRFLHTFAHASVDQYRLLKFVFSSRNMRLAVAIFLVGTLRSISLRVLIQYASARFGWKLAATGGLTSEVALVNLFLFFIIMPALIRFITQRFRPSAETLNLDIVRPP